MNTGENGNPHPLRPRYVSATVLVSQESSATVADRSASQNEEIASADVGCSAVADSCQVRSPWPPMPRSRLHGTWLPDSPRFFSENCMVAVYSAQSSVNRSRCRTVM
jgi:hypothetical protein